jgi:hypothetical protein
MTHKDNSHQPEKEYDNKEIYVRESTAPRPRMNIRKLYE